MKVAIIPARGGSKRITKKNIKLFCGKPIIAYSIALAQQSGLFDKVIVSTDCPDITAVALEWGAEVPFVRPDDLSGDYGSTNEVIKHAIEWLLDQDYSVDIACCLYATAPLLQVEDLKRGLQTLEQSNAAFAFSVTSFAFPVQRAIVLDAQQYVRPLYPQHIYKRSQDLVEAYHDAGQFYWGTAAAYVEQVDIFASNAVGVTIPRERVQDIDTEEDWKVAETLYLLQQPLQQSLQQSLQQHNQGG